ncbi:type II toxin-antitoxin system death-on-curing family toxin [Leptospira bandrabouensis]|uniref:Type II toxin-antitoxin system death-on-curing family toxin n=1 Tax=Leptospira bandrabouensis TaxID=2484903 RepID=A0A6H3NRI1_9LEPT|nr:type II toxin-antitoxin system death-on-curing family toxin [Leptospira bandrabouensis]MCG6151140.1 type II toxin-antitoxin system death-on-curing family toxin [Leptospira bandrabouensis]MCW7457334.1 type II toxin-antitoxin system death-on-curing family toxin [Leptospira bandrabouensis]MCW7476392.1 type II toxin-antitoxin system death-on-curing family toxin [Leptospira bandrabouensis]MCW7484075.1 type II toxin-antitoxin system death-on-curing family toxin [Leptospira bandrabouensis]TGN05067
MKREPKWLNRKIAEAIHLDQIKQHGGSLGIRDIGLLESALDRPKNQWHYKPESTIFALTASLGIGVAKNHPFMDGNKRTSFLLMYVFLASNGFIIDTSEEDVVNVMLKVADGSIKEVELAKWLKHSSKSNQ